MGFKARKFDIVRAVDATVSALDSHADIDIMARLAPPPRATLVAKAERSIGRPLPPDVADYFAQCNGLMLSWFHGDNPRLCGTLHLASIEEMFGGSAHASASWDEYAHEDVIWFDNEEDIRGEKQAEWLMRCKLLSSISGVPYNIVLDFHSGRGSPSVHWITRHDIHPLSLSFTEYIRLGIACGGMGYWFAAFAPGDHRESAYLDTLPPALARLLPDGPALAARFARAMGLLGL